MPTPEKTRVDTSVDLSSTGGKVEPPQQHKDTPGVDPDHSKVLSDGVKKTGEHSQGVKDTAAKGDKKRDKFAEAQEKGKGKFGKIDTSSMDLKDPTGKSTGKSLGGDSSGDKGAKTPTGAGGDQSPQYNSSVPQQQSQPTGASGPAPGGDGTPSNFNGQGAPASQGQLQGNNNLIDQLKKDIADGKYNSSGGDLDQKSNRSGSVADRIHKAAKALVDSKLLYRWGGGHGPTPGLTLGVRDGGVADSYGDYMNEGLDCSGGVRKVISDATGIDIGSGNTVSLMDNGRPVSAADARPGDLFFPDFAGMPPDHVQLFMGGDQVFEAPSSGSTMRFSKITPGGKFIRYISDDAINDDLADIT